MGVISTFGYRETRTDVGHARRGVESRKLASLVPPAVQLISLSPDRLLIV